MSVSCTLIPVALALRVIMGKERFEAWVRSMQIRMPTKIKNRQVLTSSLNRAGYDAVTFGNAVKTHIGSKKEFFFWEFENNRWIAVFSKQYPPNKINNFISNFERANNQKFFVNSPFSKETSSQVSPAQIHQCSTNFKDQELLIKTLMDYGIKPKIKGQDILIKLDNTKMRFFKKDEIYSVEIINPKELKGIFDHLSLMDEDYKHNVQSSTYEHLKRNLDDRNLKIDEEEVLDDNSIVLTVYLGN